MQKSRWQIIDEIFSGAAELHGGARDEYLRNTCRGDEGLRSEIGALLSEHESPSTGLDDPVFEIGLQILNEDSVDKRTAKILGHFRFGRLIGRGGMGEIYEAEDTRTGRKVAIKLVNELFALDPERIRRFQKEARAALRVSHPNVAKLYEICEIDGENLIVMELVDGVTLRQLFAEPMPLGEALNIAIQIASALSAAHAVGVVHRDIKPENIIITPAENVKVLDFGLAKLVEPIGDGAIQIPDGDRVELTVDMSTELGALIGTPAYMSPEQIRGGDIDTQTDIWSLGVLIYEMLTGQRPFRGNTKIDLIASILVSDPDLPTKTSIPGVSELNNIITKALHKEKSGRYQTVNEMLSDLKQILSSLRTAAKSILYLTDLSRLPDYESDVTDLSFVTTTRGGEGYYPDDVPLDADEATRGSVSGTIPERFLRRRKKALMALVLITVIASIAVPVTLKVVGVYMARPSNGLVGYWPANGDANDHAEENHGVFRNGAAFAPGYEGQAFSMNGVDNYIEVPDSRYLRLTGPFTLEARIKLVSNTTQQGIIEKYDLPGLNGYAFRVSESGKLQAIVCDPIGADAVFAHGATTVSTDEWHRVAAIYDGTTMNIYLDGVLDGSERMKVLPTAGKSSLKIGARGDDAKSRFGGLIDEVRIYDRALSYPEMLPINGLVSYWPGDGNPNDVVGANNGQLEGDATYRRGTTGQAFSFTGVNDFFKASTNGLPIGSSDRTMAMWVTIDDIQTPNPLFGGYGRWGAPDQVYSLMAMEGQKLGVTNWGEGPPTSRLETGQWYFIAATSDANSTSLYLDGKLVISQKMTLDTPADTSFYSGGMPGGMPGTFAEIRRLVGAVDEIQIYDRALSADEIQALFLSRTPIS